MASQTQAVRPEGLLTRSWIPRFGRKSGTVIVGFTVFLIIWVIMSQIFKSQDPGLPVGEPISVGGLDNMFALTIGAIVGSGIAFITWVSLSLRLPGQHHQR